MLILKRCTCALKMVIAPKILMSIQLDQCVVIYISLDSNASNIIRIRTLPNSVLYCKKGFGSWRGFSAMISRVDQCSKYSRSTLFWLTFVSTALMKLKEFLSRVVSCPLPWECRIGCRCEPGYIKDEHSNKCVMVNDCPGNLAIILFKYLLVKSRQFLS